MRENKRLIAFLAFAMYFLTGAACIVVGSSLSHLVKLYGVELERVVLLGSAYALGRVLTVYFTGRMVEKLGPMRVLTCGVLLLGIFLVGIPTFVNYYAGLVFAFLGGTGMGAQDTVCPVLLSTAFRKNYSGAMSAGQAFFGLGSFATPFLVGVMLTGQLPFYFSYYILLIVPVLMLICIPFVKMESGTPEEQGQERVRPLFAGNIALAYGTIILGDVAYCAAVNAIMTYTSSFAESIGISSAVSAFMLTTYNVGCFAGSTAFTVILKRVNERTVLLFNSCMGLAAIAAMLVIDRVPVYFICLAVAGFFLGVLFSIYVTIATRIDYRHVSRAGSVIGTAGGSADIVTPIITGAMVAARGTEIAYRYVIVMIIVMIAAAVLLLACTSEEGNNVDSEQRSA